MPRVIYTRIIPRAAPNRVVMQDWCMCRNFTIDIHGFTQKHMHACSTISSLSDGTLWSDKSSHCLCSQPKICEENGNNTLQCAKSDWANALPAPPSVPALQMISISHAQLHEFYPLILWLNYTMTCMHACTQDTVITNKILQLCLSIGTSKTEIYLVDCN